MALCMSRRGNVTAPEAAPVKEAAPASTTGNAASPKAPLSLAWKPAPAVVQCATKRGFKVADGVTVNVLAAEDITQYGRLGPHPLVVLTGLRGAAHLIPMLTAAAPKTGAVHIDVSSLLRGTVDAVTFSHAAESVASILDALSLGWAHVLTHSAGAFVAARMALVMPQFLGTLAMLDSPLTTPTIAHHSDTRAELQAARSDPNVPRDEMKFAEEQLKTNADQELVAPCPQDTSVYGAVATGARSADGRTRNDDKHTTIAHLRMIRHPMLLITPASNAVMGAEALTLHKTMFNVRRHVNLKSADKHEALFTPAAAPEIGAALSQWIGRYDQDALNARRWDTVRSELKPTGTGTPKAPAAAGGADGAAGKGKGKKGDKKAKDDGQKQRPAAGAPKPEAKVDAAPSS